MSTPAITLRTPIKVFISYSNRDREFLEQLVTYLKPLVDEGVVLSYDLALEPGTEWAGELDRLLREASIVLFLVSPDSLSSTYIERERESAISQQKRIIPILLRPCDWYSSPLSKFLALPTGAKPVTTWDNRDEAFLDIVRGLRQVIQSLQETSDVGHLPTKHEGGVNAIAISRDGRLAVSAGNDSVVIVWDTSTLQSVGVLAGHEGAVTDVKISPDGKLAATSSRDKRIRLWELSARRPLRALKGHSDTVTAVAFTEDGRRLISGSLDATLRLWELETARCLKTMRTKSEVNDVAVIPRGGWAVVGERHELSVWDLESAERVRSLRSSAFRLAVTSDGSRVISWGLPDLTVYDIDSGGEIFSRAAPSVSDVVTLPNSQHAIIAQANRLELWDLISFTEIRSASFGSDMPIAVAVTPDGTRAIWGSSTGRIFSWPIDLSVARALPAGRDRLLLAYLAVLESPELWRVLETWDESALSGIAAQLRIPPDQDLLQALTSRHPKTAPPPLWAAWMETLHASKLGKAHEGS